MAINPGYKTFTFDGKSSGDYGVYITGAAVYNSPEREVEMIQIPGRNGAFALDKGRFENIEITYPAGTFDEDQGSFAEKVSDFRNMLASRRGYCRLEDEYHPDEFRKAIYKSGLEVDPVPFQRAGEFDITFDCMPQRWLKSGETAVTIASSGDTITNPTLFESSPLLEVEGYGNIDINGFDISIENVVFGNIQISETASDSVTLDLTNCNIGDLLYTNKYMARWAGSIAAIPGATIAGQTGTSTSLSYYGPYYIGTAWSETWVPITKNVTVTYGGTTYSAEVSFQANMTYDGDNTIALTITVTKTGAGANYINVNVTNKIFEFWCESTKTILGNPTLVDCDLGEAYKVENDEIISLNAYIDLGSKLPVLSAGESEITFDNTITDLKVTPRWWKI